MAEAATGGKAITMTKCHKPNVLLVDVQMPDMNGLDALQQIRGEHAGDQGDHDLAVWQSQRRGSRLSVRGAEDFLFKHIPTEAYIAGIERAVGAGDLGPDTLFSRIKAMLHERPNPQADDVPLARREY